MNIMFYNHSWQVEWEVLKVWDQIVAAQMPFMLVLNKQSSTSTSSIDDEEEEVMALWLAEEVASPPLEEVMESYHLSGV